MNFKPVDFVRCLDFYEVEEILLGKKSASLSIYASAVESYLRNSSQSAQLAETELEGRRIGSEFFLSKCSLP